MCAPNEGTRSTSQHEALRKARAQGLVLRWSEMPMNDTFELISGDLHQ